MAEYRIEQDMSDPLHRRKFRVKRKCLWWWRECGIWHPEAGWFPHYFECEEEARQWIAEQRQPRWTVLPESKGESDG